MGLPDRERSLTISSAVWIQYTNVTDGQTDTGRQQKPRSALTLWLCWVYDVPVKDVELATTYRGAEMFENILHVVSGCSKQRHEVVAKDDVIS